MRAVLRGSLNAWIDHRAGSKGAALAFYTLFSMTPILILAIAGAGYFYGAEAAQGEIVAQVEGLVGRNGAHAIQALLAGARDPASGLAATIAASVLLLVGATSVFVELKGSLDELWGIEPRKGLAIIGFLRTRLHAFGLVLVLAFLLLVSLVLSAALAVLERFAGGIWSSSYGILALLSSVIAFAVIACLFAVIYKLLPDAHRFPGAMSGSAPPSRRALLEHHFGLVTSCPMTPPTTAPAAVPRTPPPITLPATPPMTAPVAVPFSCVVIPAQPPRTIRTAAATALSGYFLVFVILLPLC